MRTVPYNPTPKKSVRWNHRRRQLEYKKSRATMSQPPPQETIQYNHEDADKTTMLLLQDQQQQPVFVHHNHEDEDKSRSRVSLPPEELDEDRDDSLQTTAAPSYHITRLLLLGVPVLVAVVLLLSLVLRWVCQKRRARMKHHQVLTTVSKFQVEDMEVRKATTGGWHGKYTEHLFHNKEDDYNIHDQHNSRGERSPVDIEHTSFRTHASALLNETIDTNRASYNLRSTQPFADPMDFDFDTSDDDDNSFLLDDDDSDDEGIFAAVKALVSTNRKKRDGEKDTNEEFKQKLSVGI